MERILICNYSESVAKYFCTCGDPKANFCVEHRDLHEESLRDHNIKLHKYNKIDLERKQILMSQILKVKLETQNTRKTVIKKTAQFIAES